MSWFHAGIETGSPIQHGPHRLALRTLVCWVRLPWPGGGAALVFNRPIQVVVETGSAPARRLPVINATRLAAAAAILYGLAAGAVVVQILRRFSHV